jgi:hypothetical protein
MHRELVVNFLTIFLSNELCFFALLLRNWNLEFFSHFSCNWIIKSVKKLTNNTEGLRNNTSDFTRVITGLASLNCEIDDANTSER